jgi:hypothetical protein
MPWLVACDELFLRYDNEQPLPAFQLMMIFRLRKAGPDRTDLDNDEDDEDKRRSASIPTAGAPC